MANWVKRRWGRLLLGLLALGALLAASQVGFEAEATSATAKAIKKVKTKGIKGTVTDSQGRILVGATVYFIDTALVNFDPITQASMGDRTAEDRDEPLEDIIRDDVKRDALPFAITDSKGRFKAKLPVTRHFAWVEPNNPDFLPGGDASRQAFLPTSLPRKTGLAIQVSWQVPDTATHIGSTNCLVCHDGGAATDRRGWGGHAHALMYTRATGPTAIQDFSRHAGWDTLAKKFVDADPPGAPPGLPSGGTVLFLEDYDTSFGSYDNFKIFEGATGGGTVYFKVHLWKSSADGKSYLTIECVENPGDPNNFATYEVAGFWGGYISQRLLIKVPQSTGQLNRSSFEFNAIPGSPSQGLETNYDRARFPWTDAGIHRYFMTSATPPAAPTLKDPATLPANTSSTSCMQCHNGVDTQDNSPGNGLFTTVADVNGVFDTSGGSGLQELGIACEVCHGPGSVHRDFYFEPDEVISKRLSIPQAGKYIVNPGKLSVGRASMICGRCHSSVDETNPWPPVGTSRKDFLDIVDGKGGSTGVSPSSIWPDGIHEDGGHHGLTYTNYLMSKHYRNDRLLLACFDCHGMHGETDFKYGLKADPDDSATGLCQTCHLKDIRQHMEDKTGDDMKGLSTKCYECHMARTGTHGAGKPGLFNGTPTGDPAIDPDIVYWYGDQASHVWDVPSKMSPGVANTQPAEAMPTPYTNNCGTCHDATALPFLPPEP